MTSPSSPKATNSVVSREGGMSMRAPDCRASPYLVRISASALWVMLSAYAPRVVRSIIGWAFAGVLAGACGGGKAAEPRAEAAPPTARLLARARVEERERHYDRARSLY